MSVRKATARSTGTMKARGLMMCVRRAVIIVKERTWTSVERA